MASDSYTKRPRTPNDPYTAMTEEQIRNVTKNPSPFFYLELTPKIEEYNEGRRYVKRHSQLCSDSLVRDLERTYSAMYIEDHQTPQAHDSGRDMTAAKWTAMKLDRAFWSRSLARSSNCRNKLATHCRKTAAEYRQVIEAEKTARIARMDEWPEYSTYTANYLLKERLPEKIRSDTENHFELMKKHAAFGQRLQAEELEKAEQKRRQKLDEQDRIHDPCHKVVVIATPSTS